MVGGRVVWGVVATWGVVCVGGAWSAWVAGCQSKRQHVSGRRAPMCTLLASRRRLMS